MKAERRFLKTEVRASDGATPKISGYAAMFNVRSQNLGGFVEIIAPGAFDACLAADPDILCLFNHDMDAVPLGRTTSGTLSVHVDSTGLAYDCDPADTQLARDLLVSLRRKDVRGSSFGFYCLQDVWDIDREADLLVRTVQKAEVFDVSPVTNPAYLDTDASVRSQMPQNDVSLRELVASKRKHFALPSFDVRDEAARYELLLHLSAL